MRYTLVALLALVVMPVFAEDAKPETFMGARVIGRVQYEPKPTVKTERRTLDSRVTGTTVITSTVTSPPVKRVISSNELMKYTCVNGICSDYVPAIPGVVLPIQPSPDAPVAQHPIATVTTVVEKR